MEDSIILESQPTKDNQPTVLEKIIEAIPFGGYQVMGPVEMIDAVKKGYTQLSAAWDIVQQAIDQVGVKILQERFIYLIIRNHGGEKRSELYSYLSYGEQPQNGETLLDGFARQSRLRWEKLMAKFPEEVTDVVSYKTMVSLAALIQSTNHISFDEALMIACNNDFRIARKVLVSFTHPRPERTKAVQISPDPEDSPYQKIFSIHVERVQTDPIQQMRTARKEYANILQGVREHVPPEALQYIQFRGVSHLVRPALLYGVKGFSPREGATYTSFNVTTIDTEFLQKRVKDDPRNIGFYDREGWFSTHYPDAGVTLDELNETALNNLTLSPATLRPFLTEGRLPTIGVVLTAPGAIFTE